MDNKRLAYETLNDISYQIPLGFLVCSKQVLNHRMVLLHELTSQSSSALSKILSACARNASAMYNKRLAYETLNDISY